MAKRVKKAVQKKQVGLGDVVETITKATGIKKIVETIAPDDCGCKKRKEALNSIKITSKDECVVFPERFEKVEDFLWEMKKKHNMTVVRAFTEEQFDTWTTFRKKQTGITRQEQTDILFPIFLQLFARQYTKTLNCCLEPIIEQIDTVYKAYQ